MKSWRMKRWRSPFFWTIAGVIAVGLLGLADHLTGYEISVSLFYLAPIALVTWFVHERLGLILSMLSAFTWLVAELTAGQTYTHPVIYLWNTLIRFGFFVIVTYLVSEVRRSHQTERALARTDHISSAVNARYFYELLEMELHRARRYRHSFTIVCIDLDNFKQVNDTWGHDTGDELLRLIAHEMKSQLRNTDIVARLGGDEFALLLPEAGQSEAQLVISKLHADLTRQLQQKNWPVTFSVGVVSCVVAPDSAEEIMKLADELMYAVKNSTKNDIRFAVYTREPRETANGTSRTGSDFEATC